MKRKLKITNCPYCDKPRTGSTCDDPECQSNMTYEQQKRKIASMKLDPTKCWLCQINEPVALVTRAEGKITDSFKMCDVCVDILSCELDLQNRIKQSLKRADTRHIFEYCLGANLNPVRLTIERLTND